MPTSDIQFIADVLRRTRENDQLTRAEEERLSEIAEKGFSNEYFDIPGARPPEPELP